MSYNFTPSDTEEDSEDYYTSLPSLNINTIQSTQVVSPISPDEMVIRSRGRRRFPPSSSTEKDTITNPVFTRHFPSPTRGSEPPVPPKPGKTVRSHSRLSASTETVRRQLDFPAEDNQDYSILKLLPVIQKGAPQQAPARPHASEIEFLARHQVKKSKIVPNASNPSPLQLVKGLSKNQLVDLLTSLTVFNPILSSKLEELLPKPDLTSLITNMTYLSQNIYKAIPVTRLSDRTDSLAYNRVSTHLSAFKKSLVEDLSMLLGSGQWDSVLEYVITAWDIVRSTPVWDNPVHNTSRNSCFKHLATSVIKVLKQKDYINHDIRMKLVRLMTQSLLREVQNCRDKLLGE